MPAIIFTALCLMGCGFMVYVLAQWTRDTRPKTASRPEDSQARDRKQPHIVSSHKTSEVDMSRGVSTEGQFVDGEQRAGRVNPSFHDSERTAHQRIANFVIPGKKA